MVNSRNKGKRGERAFAQFLRDHGIEARRGQQFQGGPDSPDIISNLPYHCEVKWVERLNLRSACDQAEADCNGKAWIVAHKTNFGNWYVTIKAEEFLRLYGFMKLAAEGRILLPEEETGAKTPECPNLEPGCPQEPSEGKAGVPERVKFQPGQAHLWADLPKHLLEAHGLVMEKQICQICAKMSGKGL